MGQRFELTEPRLLAAQLLIDGQLPDTEIASRAGVSRSTLNRWKERHEFQDELTRLRSLVEVELVTVTVADKQARIDDYVDIHDRLRQVIEERAAAGARAAAGESDDEGAGVPGYSTGLMVRQFRIIGYGENAERIEEYKIDDGLLAELRANKKQLAQELGQWSEKDPGRELPQINTVILNVPRPDYSAPRVVYEGEATAPAAPDEANGATSPASWQAPTE